MLQYTAYLPSLPLPSRVIRGSPVQSTHWFFLYRNYLSIVNHKCMAVPKIQRYIRSFIRYFLTNSLFTVFNIITNNLNELFYRQKIAPPPSPPEAFFLAAPASCLDGLDLLPPPTAEVPCCCFAAILSCSFFASKSSQVRK